MRYALLLLLVPVLLSAGCSLLIAGAGKETSTFQTREQVHQLLGEPNTITSENGLRIEEFQSRQKYAEPIRASRIMWGLIATFGTAELIAFPGEVGRFITRRVIGHTLKFTYYADDTVASVWIDGTPATYSQVIREQAEQK